MCMPMGLFAQDDDSYVMRQLVTLKPGKDYEKLEKAMKAHNETFHKDGPYEANVMSIAHGPNAGHIVWNMGPVTYSQLDNRPSGDDHNKDWEKVMGNIESVALNEFWRLDKELSVLKDKSPKMLYVRFWNASNENGFLIDELLKKVSATHKAMDHEYSWAVWDNQFRQGSNGRHLATVSGMGSWAEMDEDYNFREKFEEIHGENSWTPFTRSMNIAFDDSWDEIWVLE